MTKRSGFTLAEVLITLGIIGVVAAMTIPTLIANTNGAKFRSQFKKTLSTLNQAGLMGQAQYDFDYSGATEACATEVTAYSIENPEGKMSFCALLNGTLTGQTAMGTVSAITLKSTSSGSTETTTTYAASIAAHSPRVLTGGNVPTNWLTYALADGSIVAFNNAAKSAANQDCALPLGTRMNAAWINSHTQCLGFIDVNGTTLPNKEVSCTTETNTSTAVETPCIVKNDAKHMTDIFPVVFHDATVEPASNAAKYVLTTSK
ncbi:type II secretion system protein [bacterium]|nr:type II secretion system protein [bacterium]